MVPRGGHTQLNSFNNLLSGGTRNLSIESLGFLARVSHRFSSAAVNGENQRIRFLNHEALRPWLGGVLELFGVFGGNPSFASSSATRVRSTEFSASTVANRAQSSSTRTKSRMVTASLSTAVAESKSGEGAMRSLTHIRRNYESPSERRESIGRRLSDRHAHSHPHRAVWGRTAARSGCRVGSIICSRKGPSRCSLTPFPRLPILSSPTPSPPFARNMRMAFATSACSIRRRSITGSRVSRA